MKGSMLQAASERSSMFRRPPVEKASANDLHLDALCRANDKRRWRKFH
jgi:hypothetical protein